MLSWLGKQVISYSMRRLSAGDLKPTLRMDAADVRMVFPGQSTWATDLRGKAEHERWLRRFTRMGIQIFPDEVIVKGFPWNTTVCVRGHDHVETALGERVYENRYVIWGRMEWGKLKQYEVYEDTQKTEAFDRWVAEHEAVPADAHHRPGEAAPDRGREHVPTGRAGSADGAVAGPDGAAGDPPGSGQERG